MVVSFAAVFWMSRNAWGERCVTSKRRLQRRLQKWPFCKGYGKAYGQKWTILGLDTVQQNESGITFELFYTKNG